MRFFSIFRNSYVALTTLVLSYLTIFTIALEPQFQAFSCSNSTFAPNSTYQSNLKSLLGNLSEKATADNYFYDQIPAGNSSNTVYGSYLCRGDISADFCRVCVATAAKEATKECLIQKEVVIWYDTCMLRYADQSFFSALETLPAIGMWNRQNASDQSEYVKALTLIASGFVTQAKNGAKKFFTMETELSTFHTMYSLMQCTPDLSGTDCDRCINSSIRRFPLFYEGKPGGRVLTPSCNIRFETYLFYNDSTLKNNKSVLVPSTSPPMATGPSLPTAPPGNDLRISGAAIAAIVLLAIIVVSVTLGCFVLRYRRLKKMRQYDRHANME